MATILIAYTVGLDECGSSTTIGDSGKYTRASVYCAPTIAGPV